MGFWEEKKNSTCEKYFYFIYVVLLFVTFDLTLLEFVVLKEGLERNSAFFDIIFFS